MMATAPTIHSPADVPEALPDAQPEQPSQQNVDSTLLSVNGTTAHDDDDEGKRSPNVEDQVNSAEASVNGGSDTEASRSGQKDSERGHNRTASSVKKPATFKAVSVNKTFLASKASPSNGAVKPTDKPRVGTSTPPPGSGSLAASKPRLVAKTGAQAGSRTSLANGKQASAPDPNAVWNKNRPIPVPDPKKMTDEDLKKYGIHMASRLEEDETQGQSKWADIDDDDDDWAPEAITWTDGTKTTLPHPDEAPPPAAVVAATAAAVPPPPSLVKEVLKEKPTSPAPPVATSSPMTKPAGLASGRGLKLKSTPQDKPTLVAKPPQPQVTKSPWATLPPIDKASPAAVEPQPNVPRGPPREAFAQRPPGPSGPPGHMPPPREFAADDFSRSTGWRDGATHGRELFNSQSGRYEPAFERRGSLRPEQPKQPHLLQRPSQSDHPEPSSAFQTHRTSHDGHFGRRRASSNVSGGSGAYYRMMKGPDGQMPPHDHLDARRPSISGSIESATSPTAVPAAIHGQNRYPQNQPGWVPHASPSASFAQTAQPGLPSPTMVQARPSQAPSQTQPGVDDVEYQKKLMRERTEAARKRRQEQEAAEEEAKRERIQKKLEALGPPPDKSPKKKSEKLVTRTPEIIRPTHIQQREEAKVALPSVEPVTQGAADSGSAPTPSAPQEKGAQESSKGGPPSTASHRRMSQGQESKQPGTWNGAGQRADSRFQWPAGAPRNVWGSPNNDRGLGNGTFNPDLVRVPGSTADPTVKGPSPIAPPGVAGPPPPTQQAPHPQAPIGSRRPGQQPGLAASQWVTAVRDGDKSMSAARATEQMARDKQLAERGLTIEDIQPAIKDTWRPVNVDGARRQMAPADPVPHQPGPWQAPGEDLAGKGPKEAPPAPHPGVIGSGSNAMLQSKQGTPNQSRTSRFFPSRDVRLENQGLPMPSRPHSPSPPPPTMEDHPVYDGNVKHPLVSLPRPQPVVKLPPAIAPPVSQHQRFNGNAAGPPAYNDIGRQPIPTHSTARRASEVSEKNWQQKFDNLFHPAKLSPPKAMGVDPASRHVLDDAAHRDTATVSLPGRGYVLSVDSSRGVTSKPMAEECFDEPEIGSLPQVKIPHKTPEALWDPIALNTKPLPRRLLVQAFAVEPIWLFEGPHTVQLRLPGMTQAKSITLPAPSGRGGRGGRGGSRGRGGRGGNRRESHAREPRDPKEPRSPKESGLPGGRGNGRGNYRGRGSDFSRSNSATQQPSPA